MVLKHMYAYIYNIKTRTRTIFSIESYKKYNYHRLIQLPISFIFLYSSAFHFFIRTHLHLLSFKVKIDCTIVSHQLLRFHLNAKHCAHFFYFPLHNEIQKFKPHWWTIELCQQTKNKITMNYDHTSYKTSAFCFPFCLFNCY